MITILSLIQSDLLAYFCISRFLSIFTCFSKKVIQDFFINYPEKIGKEYDGSTEYVCFETMLDQETKIFLSEDYFFCNMVKKIGYKVWLLPYINLNHLGTTTFSGNFTDYIKNQIK